MDVLVCKRKCKEIVELSKKMSCKIGLIKVRLMEMKAYLEIQKNFNKTVEDGIKDIVLSIEHVEENHQEIIGKETAYQQTLQIAGKDRQERHKVPRLKLCITLSSKTKEPVLKELVIQKMTSILRNGGRKSLCGKSKKLCYEAKRKRDFQNTNYNVRLRRGKYEKKKEGKKEKEKRRGDRGNPKSTDSPCPKDRRLIPP